MSIFRNRLYRHIRDKNADGYQFSLEDLDELAAQLRFPVEQLEQDLLALREEGRIHCPVRDGLYEVLHA